MTACVVFDFDGVLVDSNAVKRRAYWDIFADVPGSGPVVEAVLQSNTEDDRFGVIRAILRGLSRAGSGTAGEQDLLVAEYGERYNTICEEHAAACAEVPGASSALAHLIKRHALYIISATPEEPLRRIVARRKWSRYFRDVLGRPQTKGENLARVMRREGIEGDRIVFVGDGMRDLQAAREAGCRFVGVRNEFNDFALAGLIMVDDLTGLVELVEGRVGDPDNGQIG
jgi:phosphoglycolate phosphatase-like HAD superfamily hydrolase